MPQLKAVFDNGVSGDLPEPFLVRDTTKLDVVAGGVIAVDKAAYGFPASRCRFNEWTQASSTSKNFSWMATGFDADGVTTMVLAINATNSRLVVWRDKDPDDGTTADLERDINRTTTGTLNHGTPGAGFLSDIFQNATGSDTLPPDTATVAYVPQAAVCLPGVFLVHCQKMLNTTANVWQAIGNSLVEVRSDGAGGFTVHYLVDFRPDYASNPFIQQWERGRSWDLTGYFPFVFQQNPVLDVFIPLVDYINDGGVSPQLKGGELAIIRATRPDINTAWTFQDPYFIWSTIEDGVHFHTAAWTPRGVVLAMGDGADQNANPLFTCSDWSNYTVASCWTMHPRAYGSRGDGGSGEALGGSNQWAGSGPASQISHNHFIGGSDVTEGAIYIGEVLANNEIEYTKPWGMLAGHDLQKYVALQMSAPSKEISSRSVVRCQTQLSGDNLVLHNPVVYSADDINYCAIARQPSTHNTISFVFIFGSKILAMNKGVGSGVYTMTPPDLTVQRGLAVGPGAFNALKLDGASYFNFTQLGGTPPNEAAIVSDSSSPSSNPVIEVRATGVAQNSQLFSFKPSDTTYAGPGPVHIVFWLKSLDNTGARLRVIYISGAGNGAYDGGFVYTRDTWQLYVFTIEDVTFPNPHNATLRFEADPTFRIPMKYRIAFEGIFIGSQVGYLMPLDTTGADEQVEQRLPDLGANWSIGIELHIPASGEDYNYAKDHPGTIKLTQTLATIYVDANNYVEITADLANDEIDFHTFVGGVEVGGSPDVVTFVSMQRNNTMMLFVTFDGTNLDFYAACGGLDERGLQTQTIVATLTGGPPQFVRIGANDFAEVPNIELLMIAVDDAVALGDTGLLDMMADHAEIGQVTRQTPSITNDPAVDHFYSESQSNPITAQTGITVPEDHSLVVLISARETAVPEDTSGCTFAGQAMTNHGRAVANQSQCEVYILTDPNIVTRTGDIIVTWISDPRIAMGVAYLFVKNLDTTDPVDQVVNGLEASNTVTHDVGPINVLRRTLLLFNHSHALSEDNTGDPDDFIAVVDFTDPPDGAGALSHYIAKQARDAGGGFTDAILTLNAAHSGCTQLIALNGAVRTFGGAGGRGRRGGARALRRRLRP